MEKLEKPGQIEKWAQYLAQLGNKSSSTEGLAIDTANYLFDEFNSIEDNTNLEPGVNPCALIRVFRTIQYADLTPHLKGLALEAVTGEPLVSTNCLTLLATRGSNKDWNDRRKSANHQVIPLTSSKMVENAPMVAQLVKRLGIDVAQVVEPSATLFLSPKQKKYHVMYVPEANGDSAIVAQSEFVQPQKIRSVIGFGGLLPSGDLFAVLTFMRLFIPEQPALRFGLLAAALEEAMHQLPRERNQRAKILLADELGSSDRLIQLLGAHHEIVHVTTMDAAQAAVFSDTFDLIVCGTRFDDSRMFDLLRAVKLDKQHRPKPFICLKQSVPRKAVAEQTVPMAARLIGAACYLDAVDMTDSDLIVAINSYLPKDIWMQ